MLSATAFTFFAIWLLQVVIFYFYRVSGILTGVLFGLIFGSLSLDLLNMETIPPYILDAVIFMAIFYLGLTKPSGEFFKKYIFQYKNLILPTIATMLIVFGVAIAINFDLHIAIILVFALSVVSLSTNSVSLQFLRENNFVNSNLWRIFFAKVISNNFIIVTVFVTLLAIFDGGTNSIFGVSLAVVKTISFLIVSLAISRYIVPRIIQKLTNIYFVSAILLLNGLLQVTIAHFIGLHFMIAVFVSTLFIPEMFLKQALLEPIRENFGKFNNFLVTPLFGLFIGSSISTNILFDRELFFPFLAITFAILLTQYVSNKFIIRFTNLKDFEKSILLIGSFAKTDLSLSILIISLHFGLIDGDIFTSSIILLALLNLLPCYLLKNISINSKNI